MNETINDVLAKDYNSCVKDLKKLDKKYNKCKEKLEAYENMRKEAIELIKRYQRKDEFLSLNEWQTRDLLNILNKVGGSDE